MRKKIDYTCKNPSHGSNYPIWKGDQKDDLSKVRCSKRIRDEQGKKIGCGEKGYVELYLADKTEVEQLPNANDHFDKILERLSTDKKVDDNADKDKHKDRVRLGALITPRLFHDFHRWLFEKLEVDEYITTEQYKYLSDEGRRFLNLFNVSISPKYSYPLSILSVWGMATLKKELNNKDKEVVESKS